MAFSLEEAARIREDLIRIGREHFAGFGLRRARVEDIARDCGIAKGSFYRFFSSKEELCFEVLEEEERKRDAEMAAEEQAPENAEQLKNILAASFRAFQESSVAMRLYELDEFPVLIRKLPEKRIDEHQQADNQRMESLIAKWQKGNFPKHDPTTIAGLFRALFVLSFQRGSIGVENFDDVMDLLFISVARGLMNYE